MHRELSQLRFLLPEEACERLEALAAAQYCTFHQSPVIEGSCWHCDTQEAEDRAYRGWVARAKEGRLPAKVL